MTEMNESQLREAFFAHFSLKSNHNEARKWAQKRIEDLEKHAFDMGELLERMGKLLEQREEEIASLQSHLQERNATIDDLEEKLQDNRTHTRQTLSSMIPESDEDRHQRHRRERMLDEVTLICVRDGIKQIKLETTSEPNWVQSFRDIAENVCNSISEYDAKQKPRRGAIC